jgi:drug/metabolite transporter (DMT)-like permease
VHPGFHESVVSLGAYHCQTKMRSSASLSDETRNPEDQSMHSEAMNDPVADRLPGSGVALMLAGVLLAGINLVLTPQLGIDRDFAAVAASTVFFTRQLIASGIALLVLYGLIGLRETHAGVPGKFGVVAFALAFLGTAVLLPLEWGQAFIIHDMALAATSARRSRPADSCSDGSSTQAGC